MYRSCPDCRQLVPVQVWRQHMKQHAKLKPWARRGRGFTSEQKREVKAKQKHRCAGCQKPSQKLQVHHRNGDWRDSRTENGVALCNGCHRIADGEVREARKQPQGRRL